MRWLWLLLVLVSTNVDAATLYVNNSGSPACSDATVKASNSAASPWCTVMRAVWGSTTFSTPSTSQAAAAGDLVLITAGIYTTTDGPTSAGAPLTGVVLQPANSGTLGNPITFRGVGTVELRVSQPTSIRGPHIGSNARNYIVWDHVTINDYYQSSIGDTGPYVAFQCTGCQLINSTIQGHNGSFLSGVALYTDNYSLVRLENSADIVVRNNNISRAWGTGTTAYSGSENDACIMSYGTDTMTIENNTMDDCGVGVFIKGMSSGNSTQDTITIRYNKISDSDRGIRAALSRDVHIYQNIITGQSGRTRYGIHTGINIGLDLDGGGTSPVRPTVTSISGTTVTLSGTCCGVPGNEFNLTNRLFRMAANNVLYLISAHTTGTSTLTLSTTYAEAETSGTGWAGYPDALRARVVNNTVYGATSCLVPFGNDIVASDVHFKNNICVNATNAIENYPGGMTATSDGITSDRNWFYGTVTRHAYYGESTTYNFAAWQGTPYFRDVNSTNGTDPQFVNAAGGNFHLTGGSPALTAGRVVESIGGTNGATIPVGAYITGSETIGVESALSNAVFSGGVRLSGGARLP